jgi:hypothetical protein
LENPMTVLPVHLDVRRDGLARCQARKKATPARIIRENNLRGRERTV